jgi:acyl carrier protein
MNRADLIDLITACYRDNLPSPESILVVDEGTRIFGRDGNLDSMQIVTLLMEVEQRVNERYGTTITIADDRAMSQERSPFRTIGSLADYVAMLVTEQTPSR